MTQDTSGFYKYESEQLYYGPNFVYDMNFTLLRNEVEQYLADDIFPIDGWHFFNTDDEAYAYFGIPKPEPEGGNGEDSGLHDSTE